MPKLLVVESDDSLRARYRTWLEGARYEVVEARTASEAIARCRTDHPDLVVLDPHLGQFLGLPKGRWVAEEAHRNTRAPVVVVTGEAERADAAPLRPDAIVTVESGPSALVETVGRMFA